MLIEIESCKECKSVLIERRYTADSFETCYYWQCKETKRKKNIIGDYIDWHEKEEYLPLIPKWCPKRKKKEKKKKAKQIEHSNKFKFISK